MKWATRAGGCYCPVDILSVNTMFGNGPNRNGNTIGTDRQHDYFYLYALLDESLEEVNAELARLGHAHPSDEAFWKEALDWFEVGSVFGNDDSCCHLFWKIQLFSHNDKELCREISKLEQYFREQRPNSKLEFTKPYISSGGGCYVATAVYGSYNCPEVWTLRRFRDDWLAERAWGRSFIRFYYAVSPIAVKRFGKTDTFRRFFRKRLDRLVRHLQNQGFISTPYEDK